MITTKADIISGLQKEILPLQGYKSQLKNVAIDVGLGPVNYAFPNEKFPLGAVHEFVSSSLEDAAATCGFIAGILNSLMNNEGAILWISSCRLLFPPAIKYFGIEPDKIIFADLPKEKDVLWATEEALKCEALTAVIAEVPGLSFTTSRRLQLAVESSRVTGFILRQSSLSLSTTACVTRWKISSLTSSLPGNMPGIGYPRWNIELLKVRNGKPGTWQMEWKAGRFRHIYKHIPVQEKLQQKTG